MNEGIKSLDRILEYTKNLNKNKMKYKYHNKDLNDAYNDGYYTAIEKILTIINNWKDTSIKEKNSKIAVMITNGGYINKFDLIKKIKEMK